MAIHPQPKAGAFWLFPVKRGMDFQPFYGKTTLFKIPYSVFSEFTINETAVR